MLKDSKHDLFSEGLMYLIAHKSGNTYQTLSNPTSNVNDVITKVNSYLGGENINNPTPQNVIVWSEGRFKREFMDKIDSKISKVLCSNNGSFTSYINVTCKDTLASVVPELMVGQNVMVQCLKKCKRSIVYGTSIYSSDSNPCAAAAHSKAFFDFNGV